MTRVAIVQGCRTAFTKAGTDFKNSSMLEMGSKVIAETISRAKISPDNIDELIFSTVLLNPKFPNLAREIVLRGNFPKTLNAHFVSNNCISGLVAAAFAADGIKSGRIQSALAGGVEFMSRPALVFSDRAQKFFLDLNFAKSFSEKLKVLSAFRPKFLLPVPPSPKEPSTGLTMGQHCELSAKEFEISRAEQDKLALRSHLNAYKAQLEGIMSQEIVELNGVRSDNLIRSDASIQKLASLKPVFDRSEKGSLTAGNSSALTDGASCVLLMNEEKAAALGLEPLAFIEAIEFAGINPHDGLLMGPGLAVSNLFKKNNIKIDAVDRFEIHEAFAAQVLANKKIWENGWSKYPQISILGAIDEHKINVNGGSLAIGHPFAATGGRMLFSLAKEMQRYDLKTGVISICAAGSMAGAVLLKRN